MRTSWLTTALVVLALSAFAVASVLALGAREPRPLLAAEAAVRPSPAAAPRAEALAVLREWDERRAAAWAAGDVAALARLYLPGSRAGRRDVAGLAAWVDRGVVVSGLRTQVGSARVEQHSADRLVLVLTDRVGAAVARRDGAALLELPRDGWSTHRVDLRRVGGRWLVAEVRAVS